MEDTAVILVGGLGMRLRPLTKTIPKPLLTFGNDTILEIIVSNLSKNKFTNIFLAARYKSEKFELEIKKLKVKFPNISFHLSIEQKPLGTCGPLKLIDKYLPNTFLLMNGDVITNLKFKISKNKFLKSKSQLMVFSKQIKQPFDFGKLVIKNNKIIDILEKPLIENEIVAGIYYIKKSLIKKIPKNKYFGMDDLIKQMIKSNLKIERYLIKDFWLDLGDMQYYDKKLIKNS